MARVRSTATQAGSALKLVRYAASGYDSDSDVTQAQAPTRRSPSQ